MKKYIKPQLAIPLAIIFLSIGAYGILIPALGYYWDDWPLVWLKHALTSADYIKIFSVDRPFLAAIYTVTTSFMGENPISWHIFALISRILTSIAAWWTLTKIWPENKEQVGWIAFLFAIYPGFKQQPISVVYSNGYILYLFYILSIGLMLYAIKKPDRFWSLTLLSVFFYIASTFSTEYYIGLDMIRPVLIWFTLSDLKITTKKRIKLIIKNWSPYLIALIIFLIWRVFIFKFPTYQPVLIETADRSILNAIIVLIERIFQDVLLTGWSTWVNVFNFPSILDFNDLSGKMYWFIIFVSMPLLIFYISKTITNNNSLTDETNKNKWGPQAIGIGAASLFLAGWPYWITDLPISLEYPLDRFTLAFMLGSSIFIIGLIDWLFRTRIQKIILISVLLSFTLGSHLQNTNTYRRDWLTHNNFFWQLVWRIPALEKDSILLTQTLPITYYSDNSLTAPLNWVFAPDYQTGELPYMMVFSDIRLGGSLPKLEEDVPVNQSYRGIPFSSSTNNALTFYYSPPRCLQILDPIRDIDNPLYSPQVRDAIKLSNLDQIDLSFKGEATLPYQIFGNEPEHTWCYYYQKIELSRQKEEWVNGRAYAEEAFEKGYYPGHATEYIPLIEIYARNNEWDKALVYTNEAYQKEKVLDATLCSLLSNLQSETKIDTNQNNEIDNALKSMGCN